jgi:uncharacterized cupredoxin-like copper-binding protein
MKALPIAALTGALIAIGAFVVAGPVNTAAPVDWPRAQRLEMRMIEYEFLPNQLRLRHGLPYQLHLVNAGKEGHDFTAPDFFTSVQVKNNDALNEGGNSVFLHPEQTTDIYFIAQNAGLFAPRCADHDWAGMTATIIID